MIRNYSILLCFLQKEKIKTLNGRTRTFSVSHWYLKNNVRSCDKGYSITWRNATNIYVKCPCGSFSEADVKFVRLWKAKQAELAELKRLSAKESAFTSYQLHRPTKKKVVCAMDQTIIFSCIHSLKPNMTLVLSQHVWIFLYSQKIP